MYGGVCEGSESKGNLECHRQRLALVSVACTAWSFTMEMEKVCQTQSRINKILSVRVRGTRKRERVGSRYREEAKQKNKRVEKQ